jgi:hypothetical protein
LVPASPELAGPVGVKLSISFGRVRGDIHGSKSRVYVCLWHEADITIVLNDVRFRGKTDTAQMCLNAHQ